MLPSSTELTYFTEIAASGSLSRAAKKLHISQPTLSIAIKRLETTLNTTLFYRGKNGLTLTPSGSTLLTHAKELLTRWENIKLNICTTHQSIKGNVTIGCNPILASVMGKFISSLLENYPALQIHIHNDLSQHITSMVADASIDIGIVMNPTNHANFVVRKIMDSTMTFWTGKVKHPIQSLTSGDAVIIYDTHITQAEFLLKQLPYYNMSYSRLCRVNNLEAIANLTLEGCGVGILPTCFVKSFYPDKLFHVDNAPLINNEMCLIYRGEMKDIMAVQTVIHAIKRFIEQKQI